VGICNDLAVHRSVHVTTESGYAAAQAPTYMQAEDAYLYVQCVNYIKYKHLPIPVCDVVRDRARECAPNSRSAVCVKYRTAYV